MSDYPRSTRASERLERARLTPSRAAVRSSAAVTSTRTAASATASDRIDERPRSGGRGAQVAHQAVDAPSTDLARRRARPAHGPRPREGAARRPVNDAKDKARRADSAARKYR
jgi:hypothetical protein